jgi:phosphatidate cytidylyltransferase
VDASLTSPTPWAQFRVRLLTALVLLPPLFAALWLGGPWFRGLLALVALLAVWEFTRLPLRPLPGPLRWSPVLLGALPLWPALGALPAWASALLFGLLGALLFPWLLGPFPGPPLARWSLWAGGAFLYVVWPLALLAEVRTAPLGRQWLLWLVVLVFATDTAAYIVGRLMGRTPLAPRISPAKTWEGALGGLSGGAAAAVVAAPGLGLPLTSPQALLLGGALSCVAQLGDLFESALKRRLGVKDFSALLPGHGGLLDRLDSILLTGLVLYWLLAWLGHLNG